MFVCWHYEVRTLINLNTFFLLHETIAQITIHITWDYNWYLQIRILLGPTYINANRALPRFLTLTNIRGISTPHSWVREKTTFTQLIEEGNTPRMLLWGFELLPSCPGHSGWAEWLINLNTCFWYYRHNQVVPTMGIICRFRRHEPQRKKTNNYSTSIPNQKPPVSIENVTGILSRL